MIGSHDTFTYLSPINPIFNIFKRWWKCQTKTIDEQYKFGIRFFDIRVVWYKGNWHFAHGLVIFKGMQFIDITNLCAYIDYRYPEAIYRIVLERGSKKDIKRFHEDLKYVSKFKGLWRADIKSTNRWLGIIYNTNINLYKIGYAFAKVNPWEFPSHELHGYIDKSNWYKINLKKEAKQINSKLDFFNDKNKLKQIVENKDELYFIDYCTNEY